MTIPSSKPASLISRWKQLPAPVYACLAVSFCYVALNLWLAEPMIKLVRNAANPYYAGFLIFVTVIGQILSIYQTFRIVEEGRTAARIAATVRASSASGKTAFDALSDGVKKLAGGIAAMQLFVGLRDLISRGAHGQDRIELRNELNAFEGALAQRSTLPSHIANNLIGLGLFGTFLGLIVTLKEVGALIGLFSASSDASSSDVMNQFFQQMKGPLSGMGDAFVSSLVGLGGSMVNALQVLAIKKLQLRTTHEVETNFFEVADALAEESGVTVTHQSFAEDHVVGADEAIRLMAKQTDAVLLAASHIRQVGRSLEDVVQTVEKRFDQYQEVDFSSLGKVVGEQLQIVVRKIEEAIEKLGLHKSFPQAFEYQEKLNQALTNLTLQGKGIAAELAAMRTESSQRDLVETANRHHAELVALRTGVMESLAALGLANTNHLERLHQGMGVLEFNASKISGILSVQSDGVAMMVDRLEKIGGTTEGVGASLDQALHRLRSHLADFLARAEANAEQIELMQTHELANLQRQVDRIAQATVDRS